MEYKQGRELEDSSSQKRFAFSYQIGSINLKGEQVIADKLKRALSQEKSPYSFSEQEQEAKESLFLTHLFHSYSARTHPLTVRALLEELQEEQVVFDPFVGSGTTLVETALRGGQGIGCDISELSVRLSRFKATRMPKSMRTALKKKGEQVVTASLQRVKKEVRPSRTWDQPDYYEYHVYKELCGLREEIELISSVDRPLYDVLLLLFSSLVIKASKQNAESSSHLVKRHIGKGQVTRWFQQRLDEVIRLHALFENNLPQKNYIPLVFQMDARELYHQKKMASASIDIVLTSPPYLGVYNYLDHQLRRSAWLELSTTSLLQNEIGSRRDSKEQSLQESQIQYQQDTNSWVRGITKMLRKDALIYVIIGDSYYGREVIDGSTAIYQAMRNENLEFLASCSVERFYGQTKKQLDKPNLWEHVLCFTKPF